MLFFIRQIAYQTVNTLIIFVVSDSPRGSPATNITVSPLFNSLFFIHSLRVSSIKTSPSFDTFVSNPVVLYKMLHLMFVVNEISCIDSISIENGGETLIQGFLNKVNPAAKRFKIIK